MLKTWPVAEADRVVALFSGEEGKVRGWARGVRRPRSRLGSALETGNEVVAGWFEREGRELVQLDHAELAASALPLVRDPVRGATLRFFVDLVDLFAVEREANPRLYRLMTACRDALLGEVPPAVAAAYFEAWVLRLSGLYPRPAQCACGAGFTGAAAHFLAAGPVWCCSACIPGGSRTTAEVPGPALSLLDEIWRLPPDRVARRAAEALDLFRFHGVLTGAAAERRLPSRDALGDLFSTPGIA